MGEARISDRRLPVAEFGSLIKNSMYIGKVQRALEECWVVLIMVILYKYTCYCYICLSMRKSYLYLTY